jgi:hypothetical protein
MGIKRAISAAIGAIPLLAPSAPEKELDDHPSRRPVDPRESGSWSGRGSSGATSKKAAKHARRRKMARASRKTNRRVSLLR